MGQRVQRSQTRLTAEVGKLSYIVPGMLCRCDADKLSETSLFISDAAAESVVVFNVIRTIIPETVLGQNGSGQNGTDEMVWTKWYTDKMLLDKMVWTKWYEQNGTYKILRIKSSINLAPIDNMIFFYNPASILTPFAFLFVLFIYL